LQQCIKTGNPVKPTTGMGKDQYDPKGMAMNKELECVSTPKQ